MCDSMQYQWHTCRWQESEEGGLLKDARTHALPTAVLSNVFVILTVMCSYVGQAYAQDRLYFSVVPWTVTLYVSLL